MGTYLFISLLMIIPLFLHGLYDPSEWLPFLVLILLSTLFVWFYVRVIKKEKLNPSYLVLCVFPLLYILSLLGGVESVEGTLMRFLQWSLYPCFLFLLFVLRGKKQRTLEPALVIFSYAYVVCTYLYVFKILSYPSFWLGLNEDVSGLGTRLAGFFEYPNALGIVAASLLFFHLMHTVQENRPRWGVIHSFPILSYGLFLLLTESRGAMLSFLICWMIGLWFVKKNHLLRYVYLTLVIGLMLFAFSWFLPLIVEGRMVMLVVIVAASAVYSLLAKQRITYTISRPFLIPVITTLFVVALIADLLCKGLFYRVLPDVLQNRLSMGTGTLTERFLYIRDVWTEVDRFVLNGAGGMAWKSLMYQTQSGPYISHELHNGYMNMLVETGILGFVLFLFVVGYAIVYMFRRRSLYFLSFMVIVLHGVMDFSLSYSSIVCLLLFYFAASYEKENQGRLPNQERIGSVLFIMMISSALVFSFRFVQADKFAQQGEWVKAIAHNPYRMSYRLELGTINLKEQIEIVEEGLPYEPNHSYAIYQLGKWYAEAGNEKRALRLYTRSLSLDRFDTYKYEGVLHFLVEQSNTAKDKGRNEEAQELGKKASQVYKNMQRLVEGHPLANQRNFYITEETKEIMEKLEI